MILKYTGILYRGQVESDICTQIRCYATYGTGMPLDKVTVCGVMKRVNRNILQQRAGSLKEQSIVTKGA
jgi:hypothetical protein